jgi:hypothetical protein
MATFTGRRRLYRPGNTFPTERKLGVEDYYPTECDFPEHMHMQLVGVDGETWHGDQYWSMGNLFD